MSIPLPAFPGVPLCPASHHRSSGPPTPPACRWRPVGSAFLALWCRRLFPLAPVPRDPGSDGAAPGEYSALEGAACPAEPGPLSAGGVFVRRPRPGPSGGLWCWRRRILGPCGWPLPGWRRFRALAAIATADLPSGCWGKAPMSQLQQLPPKHRASAGQIGRAAGGGCLGLGQRFSRGTPFSPRPDRFSNTTWFPPPCNLSLRAGLLGAGPE